MFIFFKEKHRQLSQLYFFHCYAHVERTTETVTNYLVKIPWKMAIVPKLGKYTLKGRAFDLLIIT